MNTLKLSAWLGLVMSALGAVLKVVRVMRQAEWWPFVVYDYLAIALLVVGAIVVLRGGAGRWLAAGWGFSVAMTYGSFFSHLEKVLAATGRDLAFEHSMVVSVSLLLTLNIVGLALALWPPMALKARFDLAAG